MSEICTRSEKIANAIRLQNAVSTVLGPATMSRVRELTVYVIADANVTTGSIVVEGACDPAYAGTWALLATIALTGASRALQSAITGVHMAVRCRINGADLGSTGTVDIHAVMN